MANVTVTMPDELMKRLTLLGEKQDAICAKCLDVGAEVLVQRVERNLAARIGEGTKYASRSTGELIGSLGKSPAKIDKNGRTNIKVGFSEPRRGEGDANAKIAAILEYGKSGQPAKPFLKPAYRSAKNEIEAAMVAEFERQVNAL